MAALELALRESLRESNRHNVWHDDIFKVSREADALASTQDLLACLQTTLPYGNSVPHIASRHDRFR
jgi:hypothetical protein